MSSEQGDGSGWERMELELRLRLHGMSVTAIHMAIEALTAWCNDKPVFGHLIADEESTKVTFADTDDAGRKTPTEVNVPIAGMVHNHPAHGQAEVILQCHMRFIELSRSADGNTIKGTWTKLYADLLHAGDQPITIDIWGNNSAAYTTKLG